MEYLGHVLLGDNEHKKQLAAYKKKKCRRRRSSSARFDLIENGFLSTKEQQNQKLIINQKFSDEKKKFNKQLPSSFVRTVCGKLFRFAKSWFSTFLLAGFIAVILLNIPKLIKPKLPLVIRGFVAPGFESVEETFSELVKKGYEPGAAFSVYHKGKLVVDLWGGYADKDSGQPWENDTVSKWFSVTKGVSSIVVASLVDRGLLSYQDKISKHWKDFAQNGKENITVAQLLSHQAGLAVFEEPFQIWKLSRNHKEFGVFLARQKPVWTPGSRHGYHAISFGPYVDQLVRHIDPQHRGLKQIFHEEIAIPFDIDFYIGLPRELHHRAAKQDPSYLVWRLPFTPWKFWRVGLESVVNPWSLVSRLIRQPSDLMQPPFEKTNRPDYRSWDLASSQGYGTSKAVAKLFGILSSGGFLGNKQLLSADAISKLSTPVIRGYDEIMLDESIFSHGLRLYERFKGTQKERLIIGHPGIGGQMGYADLESELGWGYLTNYFTVCGDGDQRNYLILEEAMYKSVVNLEFKSGKKQVP